MSTTHNSGFTLPPDHVFTPSIIVMQKSALERLIDLYGRAENRDPDRFHMYIYNDFFGYGVIELVHETLSSIHTIITKKKWLDAWHLLTALTNFNCQFDVWHSIDDGEQTIATERVYGAFAVTIVRALSAAGKLNEETIPDLEYYLKEMASWGDQMQRSGCGDSCYAKVLKGFGVKLFGERTPEERTRRFEAKKAAYIQYVEKLSEAEKTRKYAPYDLPGSDDNEDEDEDEEEDEDEDEDEDDNDDEDEDNEDEESEDRNKEKPKEKKKAKLWFEGAKAKDADFNSSYFKMTPAWKEYKAHLAGVPRGPRVASSWDLTKWTKKEKEPYLFSNM